MNWNQYFALKDKQRSRFIWFFILFFILSVFYFKEVVINGPDFICANTSINTSIACVDAGSNMTLAAEPAKDNESLLALQSGVSEGAEENVLNPQEAAGALLPESEPVVDNRSFFKKATENTVGFFATRDYSGILWFRCSDPCQQPFAVNAKRILLRFVYTPLFIVADLVVAWLLSALLLWNEERKLSAKAAEEGEKKDDKGEKK